MFNGINSTKKSTTILSNMLVTVGKKYFRLIGWSLLSYRVICYLKTETFEPIVNFKTKNLIIFFSDFRILFMWKMSYDFRRQKYISVSKLKCIFSCLSLFQINNWVFAETWFTGICFNGFMIKIQVLTLIGMILVTDWIITAKEQDLGEEV